MSVVHVVLPGDIDDPARPSGGNLYDRQVCRGLAATGWTVHEHPVPGPWPRSDAAALSRLDGTLDGVDDGALVLLDGLVASAAPEQMRRHSSRLRLVVLVHMPVGAHAGPDAADEARTREHAALATAAAVITTSRWTRRWLLERYALPNDRVSVAEPGVDPADQAPGTASGGRLLCVAAVTEAKGHDLLLAALATVADLPWSCVCVGSLDLEPDFVDRLHRQADQAGIADRVRFAGPLTGSDLQEAYAAADVLVLPSRAETYAMVVTEALARGLPVIAGPVGGVPEALGSTTPGLLVTPDDAGALAEALRCWLLDGELRQQLRAIAAARRPTLPDWSSTSRRIAEVLSQVPR